MSVTQQQVISLLENVLFETATQATANAGTWINNSAAGSVQSLAAAMANSGEEKIAATVVGYYLTSLGRAPNAAEIQYYVAIAEQGLTQTQIAAGQVSSAIWDTIGSYFAHSSEFGSRGNIDFSLGNTAAYLEAVPWLYQSVLGRAASNAELAYYDTQVVNGTDLGVLFREFTASPEFTTDTASQIAQALANYGIAVASGGQAPAGIGSSVTLGPPAPPSAPVTVTAPIIPASEAFTTGTDTFDALAASTVYNAILGGASATLTANDSLIGAGNILNITDTSGAASQDELPSTVTLHNIVAVTLTTSGNAGVDANHLLDLSGVTGLTSFSLTAAGNQGDFLAVGTGVAVTLQTASATVDITTGFASLALTDNHLSSLDLTGTGGALTFTDPSGPTSLTINASALTLHADITDASNHITTLTIDGGSGAASYIDNFLHIGGYSIIDSALTNLTIAGNVTFGAPLLGVNLPSSLSAFDSSTATGSIYLSYSGSGATFTLGNSTVYLTDEGGNTITGTGAGVEIFSGGTGTGESITLGNGGNYISLNDAGNDTVSLGNGANTLVISANYGSASGDAITMGNGNNAITDNGSGGNTITLGTGNNTVDMGGVTDNIVVGPDAAYFPGTGTANLVITHPGANFTLTLSGITAIANTSVQAAAAPAGTSAADEISTLAALLVGLHTPDAFATGVDNGETFLLLSASGTVSGPGDVTVIEIMGTHLLQSLTGNTFTF